MFKKCVSFFRALVSTAKSKLGLAVAGVSVASVGLLTGSAFAADPTPQEIIIQSANINWQGLPEKLFGALGGPIVVGIGIGLSVMIVWLAVKFLRRGMLS